MIAIAVFLLVLAVCGFVVMPLFARESAAETGGDAPGGELWSREKAVAVLAIVEADFDRATGKLSDEDYRVLRSDYEGRALQAMDELSRSSAAAPDDGEPAAGARFCGACGSPFEARDRFCSGCGAARLSA